MTLVWDSSIETGLLKTEIKLIFLPGLRLFSFEAQGFYHYKQVIMMHVFHLVLLHCKIRSFNFRFQDIYGNSLKYPNFQNFQAYVQFHITIINLDFVMEMTQSPR